MRAVVYTNISQNQINLIIEPVSLEFMMTLTDQEGKIHDKTSPSKLELYTMYVF